MLLRYSFYGLNQLKSPLSSIGGFAFAVGLAIRGEWSKKKKTEKREVGSPESSPLTSVVTVEFGSLKFELLKGKGGR
ncbi:hypothetical protein TIFTF001_006148 [Ficus carica]|uniref:Uncharacterized protein n=1 Tax=Ficus carica TaxID=3494 RepID=A0AA87ZGU7_FICCA|nr:hypothetical protein TIFTF001_006148 [Ficus carica]